MLTPIEFDPKVTRGKNIVGLVAKGKVTAEDYQKVLVPYLEKARLEGKKVRFLAQLGEQFEGFKTGAVWEDFKLSLHHTGTIERCAIVSDGVWVRGAGRFFGPLLPCPVMIFSNEDLEPAKQWLASSDRSIQSELNELTGILKVEITGPLSSENFNELAEQVDPWIERVGQLKGLIIHAKKFPGWEDLGSMISHFDFVKGHHQQIGRVAFCADGLIASLVSPLAGHFVSAEVRHFDYHDLERAMAWAGEGRSVH